MNLVRLSFLLLCFIIFQSCVENEDDNLNNDLPVYNSSRTVRSNGVILDFFSADEYFSVLEFFNPGQNKTFESGFIPQSPKDLAESLNFTSMGHIFDRLNEKQNEYINQIYSKYGDSLFQKIENNEISGFIQIEDKYRNFIELDKDKLSLKLNFFDKDLAYLLNENGNISISGALYQYTNESIKYINSVDLKDLNVLNRTITETDQIKISKVEKDLEYESHLRTGEESCIGTRNGTKLFFIGKINHIAYSQTINVCTSDPSCWETGAIQCCENTTTVFKSNFKVDLHGYSKCGVNLIIICFERPQAFASFNISGNFSYKKNGITYSVNNYSISNTNSTCLSGTLYHGDRIYEPSAQLTFNGVYDYYVLIDESCSINY